jgi:hypothetical protein
MKTKPDAEISITRFCNEENTPIRIAIAAVGDPSRRLLVDLGLDQFALALTGMGNVPGLVHRNTLESDTKARAALVLFLQFLDTLPEGWLGNVSADIGLLNRAYMAARALGVVPERKARR